MAHFICMKLRPQRSNCYLQAPKNLGTNEVECLSGTYEIKSWNKVKTGQRRVIQGHVMTREDSPWTIHRAKLSHTWKEGHVSQNRSYPSTEPRKGTVLERRLGGVLLCQSRCQPNSLCLSGTLGSFISHCKLLSNHSDFHIRLWTC